MDSDYSRACIAIAFCVSLVIATIGTLKFGNGAYLYHCASGLVVTVLILSGLAGVRGVGQRILVTCGLVALSIGLSWFTAIPFVGHFRPTEDHSWEYGFGLLYYGFGLTALGVGFLLAARDQVQRAARAKRHANGNPD